MQNLTKRLLKHNGGHHIGYVDQFLFARDSGIGPMTHPAKQFVFLYMLSLTVFGMRIQNMCLLSHRNILHEAVAHVKRFVRRKFKITQNGLQHLWIRFHFLFRNIPVHRASELIVVGGPKIGATKIIERHSIRQIVIRSRI